ncbi:DUF1566 domain-containing protein [Desulfococcaceae bacterium HSG9]|nr:DUF1566 domain-containing protein [Desulfococcaceae bacterium HSG9]
MTLSLTTSNKQIIKVKDSPIASGGEGAVHEIVSPSSMCNSCVKLYSVQHRTPQREQKTAYMIYNPPPGLQTPNYLICWPAERVYENNGFAGFVMPLAYSGSISLYEICTTKIKDRMPDVWKRKYDRSTNAGMISRLKLCVNIAIAVHSIHLLGKYVLIDMKPQNILITHDGKICIIDTDSIQIANGKQVIYPGPVATPEYIPPEGKNLSPSKNYIPECWDRFSIAVMFYEILFGLHPFASTASGKYKDVTTILDKIQNGLSHLGTNSKYIVILPSLHKNLRNVPKSVQILFYKTFKYGHSQPDARPGAEIWGETIYSEITQQKNLNALGQKLSPAIKKAPRVSSKKTQIPKQPKAAPKSQSFFSRFPKINMIRVLAIFAFIALSFILVNNFKNTRWIENLFESEKARLSPKITPTPTPRPTQNPTVIPKVTKPPKPDSVKSVRPSVRLRSSSKVLSKDDVITMLKKHNFFDSNWNQSGDFKNDFKDNGNGTVTDRKTGLMWQKGGSKNSMNFKDTAAYVRQVNQKGLGGYNDWRLPTIEELATLLKTKEMNGGLYNIDPVFDKKQWCCWSSDTVKGSSRLAWDVLFGYGIVERYRISDGYVRVVRAGQSPRPTPNPTVIPKVTKPPKPDLVKSVKPIVNLRSRAKTLSGDDVKAMLKKHNFSDKYKNESGDFKNDFKDNGNGTITDRKTGLMWQKGGSKDYMEFKDTAAYVRQVNQKGLGGHDDWRLPTLEELASLLERQKMNGDLYIDPVFDKKQWWCWSSDTVEGSSGSAWVVYFGLGNVDSNDFDGVSYVRLVRAGQ